MPVLEALANLSDCELMRRVQAGQEDLFAMLARRYQAALLRVAESRLGRREWAEDVVQETFLAAFKGRMTFRVTANFRTWLWTIHLNQCRREYRRRMREPRVEVWSDAVRTDENDGPVENHLVDREASPPAQFFAREQTAHLESLLARLSEVEADALRLRFFAGLKFREISEAMPCSLATAKNRVRRGLIHIAEMLADDASKGAIAAQSGDVP